MCVGRANAGAIAEAQRRAHSKLCNGCATPKTDKKIRKALAILML